MHAASISASQKGVNDLAAVLKEANRSPSRHPKIRKMFFISKKDAVAYTAEEALEFIFESNLSKQQYLKAPQSIRFFSSLKLEYTKETKEHVLKEKKRDRPAN